jgi:hypothetical protein
MMTRLENYNARSLSLYWLIKGPFTRNRIFVSHSVVQHHATQLGLILTLVAWCRTTRRDTNFHCLCKQASSRLFCRNRTRDLSNVAYFDPPNGAQKADWKISKGFPPTQLAHFKCINRHRWCVDRRFARFFLVQRTKTRKRFAKLS